MGGGHEGQCDRQLWLPRWCLKVALGPIVTIQSKTHYLVS